MRASEQFAHWREVRRGFVQALDWLSDEQLPFVPREGLWSLGEVAVHIADVEEGWFRHVVTGELADWPRLRAADYPGVAAIKLLLAEVHGRTESYLAGLDAADLDRVVTTPWGARATVGWVVWHVLEHEIHHRGEIFLMLGLMGMEAPDV